MGNQRGSGSDPNGIYRKGPRKMPLGCAHQSNKEHCSGAPSTEINMSRPSQKEQQGPRHVELCSRRPVLITSLCWNIFPPIDRRTAEHPRVPGRFPAEPLRRLDATCWAMVIPWLARDGRRSQGFRSVVGRRGFAGPPRRSPFHPVLGVREGKQAIPCYPSLFPGSFPASHTFPLIPWAVGCSVRCARRDLF